MKKQVKKGGKVTIAQVVLGLIKAGNLTAGNDKDGKKALSVIAQVKRQFPSSKFQLSHYYWYVNRFRRQTEQGLGVDRLHALKPTAAKPEAKKTTVKPVAKATKKASGKKVTKQDVRKAIENALEGKE